MINDEKCKEIRMRASCVPICSLPDGTLQNTCMDCPYSNNGGKTGDKE